MDPLTLAVAFLFADMLTGGWVHSTLLGGVKGAGREAWADLAPRVPPTVRKSRGVRYAVATGRGVRYGGGAAVRGVRRGFVPGARAGHQEWQSRTHWWDRARGAWGRLRVWVEGRRSRPAGAPAPSPAGPGPQAPPPRGSGPGGGRGTPGSDPRPPRGAPPSGGTPTGGPGPGASTPGPPVPAGAPASPGPPGGPVPAPAPAGGPRHLTVVPDPPDPGAPPGDTTPDTDSSTPTNATEDPDMSAATVDVTTPNTSTEDVPAHIAAGLDLADAIEDIAEQYTCTLEDTVRRHIDSAEGLPGFPPSLQGEWEDGVMQPLNMISTLLAQAAEAARGAAEAERKALEQSVEAADNAPSDSDLPQSVLRTN